MNYQSIRKAQCVGAGGGALYYVIRFFHSLGVAVTGYDIAKNDRMAALRKLKKPVVTIILANPAKPFPRDTDIIIYSNALPDRLIEKLKKNNKSIRIVEVGLFVSCLIRDFERGRLTQKEAAAFGQSNMAPLHTVDYSKEVFIGVTGTDGKTTVSAMLFHILKKLGFRPAVINTLSARVGSKVLSTGLHTTTPSPQEIFRLIQLFRREGATHIILEATSHGLAMGRLAGLKLDVAVYTNITSDHLDYHKTWEQYAGAKAKLGKECLKPNGTVVLNANDTKSYAYLRPQFKKVAAYAVEKDIRESVNGIVYPFEGEEYTLPILGRYNVSNALACAAALEALSISAPRALEALSDFRTVKGRMQILQKEPYVVVVDFAHTPNALKSVLQSATKLKRSPSNKLVAVFGCAGKRDNSKRGPMGQIAAELADTTILTAEDPRSESLKSINNEIAQGWEATKTPRKRLIRFDDGSKNVAVRRAAIAKSLELARPGDVVIICGKAHEQSLCFGSVEYSWDDIKETKKLLK
ncbi:MAG: UDP-N-acetylmuramyl-tripeptide synthetase [bacterium]